MHFSLSSRIGGIILPLVQFYFLRGLNFFTYKMILRYVYLSKASHAKNLVCNKNKILHISGKAVYFTDFLVIFVRKEIMKKNTYYLIFASKENRFSSTSIFRFDLLWTILNKHYQYIHHLHFLYSFNSVFKLIFFLSLRLCIMLER